MLDPIARSQPAEQCLAELRMRLLLRRSPRHGLSAEGLVEHAKEEQDCRKISRSVTYKSPTRTWWLGFPLRLGIYVSNMCLNRVFPGYVTNGSPVQRSAMYGALYAPPGSREWSMAEQYSRRKKSVEIDKRNTHCHDISIRTPQVAAFAARLATSAASSGILDHP
jgi:hypothetical protein